jgi:site-specific DNA-methyltransferase (adenine-specific)/modification methylase
MSIIREERIGDCRLILGDCLSIMPLLGKVDAVVTDPPYGVGESGAKSASRGKLAESDLYAHKKWDEITLDEHVSMAVSMADKAIVFGGNYYDLPPTTCWLVWDKQNGTNDFADCELAWTNLNKAVRRINWLWKGMIRKGDDVRRHPTQKPLGVIEWCIHHLPETSQTILDPFMGSGTTLVACAKLGRKGIGIELDPDYFQIACDRVQKAHDQPDLFVAPPKAPTQEGMDI